MTPQGHDIGESYTWYDFGWNDQIRGVPFNEKAMRDWREGWKDAATSPEKDRILIEYPER